MYHMEVNLMSKVAIDLEVDIQPVSDFRARASAVLKQVQTSGRPVVLTQHGRSAAVLVDVRSYQALVDEVDVLRDIIKSRADHDAGRTVSHEEARERLLARYK